MAAEPCKKCGKLRKIDIIISSDGWHQPPCYNCDDPGYIESIEKEKPSDLQKAADDSIDQQKKQYPN